MALLIQGRMLCAKTKVAVAAESYDVRAATGTIHGVQYRWRHMGGDLISLIVPNT